MTEQTTPDTQPVPRAPWIAPAVTRIRAGDAENGLNNVRSDGPISTGS